MMRTHLIQYRLRAAGRSLPRCWHARRESPLRQPADQFFKGKIINLYIGFAAGGSYDYYARLVARFIGKNIPGNPTVVAQTMAGAGSFQAANFLFAAAPRDGTAMGIITQTLAIEDALRSPAVHYKASEFTWIGRATAILEVALTGQTAKAKTIDDARRYETPVAGTGAGSPSEGYPKLLNALAGTRFKVISGYQQLSPEYVGDGAGRGGWRIYLMEHFEKDEAGVAAAIIRSMFCTNARLNGIPICRTFQPTVELGKTPEAKQILAFYTSSAAVGRSIMAPPGMPADRVKVLRTAFDAMVKDPEFLAEIERAQQEFQPASGEELQKLIQDTASVSAEIVERTGTILRSK